MPCFCMALLMLYTVAPASERAAAPLPMQSRAFATFRSKSSLSMMQCTENPRLCGKGQNTDKGGETVQLRESCNRCC